jgi:hypothetical protein
MSFRLSRCSKSRILPDIALPSCIKICAGRSQARGYQHDQHNWQDDGELKAVKWYGYWAAESRGTLLPHRQAFNRRTAVLLVNLERISGRLWNCFPRPIACPA